MRFERGASLTIVRSGEEDIRVALARLQGPHPRVVASGYAGPATRRVELGPAQPGPYELLVFLRLGDTCQVVAARSEVHLAPGPNEVAVDLPRTHRLVVTGLTSRGPLQLVPEARLRWGMCRRVAGEDGTVDFETLPAGRYLLTTGAEGMLLQLEGPAEIRFEGRTLDALEVEFAPGAPDRRLGLRSGDVIVGAGGKPFASLDDARLKLRDAAATLLVRREGTTTEVGVDLGELRRALEAGELSITPTLR